jgi:WD40 repeat protein
MKHKLLYGIWLHRNAPKDTPRVSSLAFSYDSKLRALSSSGGIARVRDTATGQRPEKYDGPRGVNVHLVAFSYDTKLIVSDGSLYLLGIPR